MSVHHLLFNRLGRPAKTGLTALAVSIQLYNHHSPWLQVTNPFITHWGSGVPAFVAMTEGLGFSAGLPGNKFVSRFISAYQTAAPQELHSHRGPPLASGLTSDPAEWGASK
jgi:hypothetical protein